MTKHRQLDMRWAVLSSINRLCKKPRFTAPTLDDIKRDLTDRYGSEGEVTDRYLLEIISDLERQHYITRRKGVLKDGRETVYLTNKGEQVVLSLIKIGENQALVHDGWEGIVYDPSPSNVTQKVQNGDLETALIPLGLMVLVMSSMLYFMSRLPKPMAKWTCIRCGRSVESRFFNDIVQCFYCGQAYYVTIDRVWLFPFSNPPRSVAHQLSFF